MNGRRKMDYQGREIVRLRDENRELQSELNVATKEINSKDKAISDLKEEVRSLRDQIKEVHAQSAEDTKKLNEARDFYQNAARSARKIEHDYKELIAKLGIELKYSVKGGV